MTEEEALTEEEVLRTAHRGGRYGGRSIAWVEAEIDWWVTNQIRAARGLAPLPPPEIGPHPVLIRDKEVERRTGIGRVVRWKMEKAGRHPKRVFLYPEEVSDAAA